MRAYVVKDSNIIELNTRSIINLVLGVDVAVE